MTHIVDDAKVSFTFWNSADDMHSHYHDLFLFTCERQVMATCHANIYLNYTISRFWWKLIIENWQFGHGCKFKFKLSNSIARKSSSWSRNSCHHYIHPTDCQSNESFFECMTMQFSTWLSTTTSVVAQFLNPLTFYFFSSKFVKVRKPLFVYPRCVPKIFSILTFDEIEIF